MNKKLIRLTESDLHRIVKRSVNKVLKENDYTKGVDSIERTPFGNVDKKNGKMVKNQICQEAKLVG